VADQPAVFAWRFGHPAVARRVMAEPGELAADGRLIDHRAGLVAGDNRRQERHE